MGIIDINKRIDNYKSDISNDLIKLSNGLLEFQQNSIDRLKEFL